MWHCSIPWLTGTQFSLWIPALRLAICDLLHYHLAPLLQSDDLFAACLLFGHFLCLLLRLHHPVCLCGYIAKSLGDWWQFRFEFKVSSCFIMFHVGKRFWPFVNVGINWNELDVLWQRLKKDFRCLHCAERWQLQKRCCNDLQSIVVQCTPL